MRNWFYLGLVLFSPAVFAQDAGPSSYGNIFLLAGFFFIFYFMLIRPQTKRAKAQQMLIANIAKDDEVITSGGMLGTVLKVTDQFLVLSIADGIEIKIQKQAVASCVPKGTIKTI